MQGRILRLHGLGSVRIGYGGDCKMKKILKSIGRIFMILTKTNEHDMRQSVLLIDGGFILPNNFALIIKGVKEKFQNAKLTILTFSEKKDFLTENFPDAEIIIPGDKGIIKKYRLAMKLFSLQLERYSFIVLSSLDVSLVLIVMLFGRQPVFLYNRWFEWYRVRHRTFLDVFLGTRSADGNRRKENRSMQEAIRSLGRSFMVLSSLREEDMATSALVIDDGRGDLGYITTAVKKSKIMFINPDISVMTFPGREHYFTGIVPEKKVIAVKNPYKKLNLVFGIYRAAKTKFNYVVLTNLDMVPIFASFLFMNSRVVLYNKWHEWWILSLRTMYGYVEAMLGLLRAMVIFAYLLIACGFVLLKTYFGLLSGRAHNREKTDE
jgi:hypothetical protein